MQKITQQELKELFIYNPENGSFKKRSSQKYVNKTASGYTRIGINGKSYLAHHLAWLYYYGEFPKINLDHINRNPGDNRIENLRELSREENAINILYRSNNTSGVAGVSFHRASNKWQARISDNRKNIALGIYNSFADAVKVRYDAELRLGYDLINNCSPAKKYLLDNGLL